MLFGQQEDIPNSQYPFFLCLWNSRAKNYDWILELWPKRNVFTWAVGIKEYSQ